ncbi:MAG: aspartate kinase [Bacteroidales bacterium]
MKVLKFGGTSVGSAARIRSIANLLPGNEPCIVVLSAMAGTTNALIDITNDAANGKIQMASEKTKKLEEKYIATVEDLYQTKTYQSRGREFIGEVFQQIGRKIDDNFSAKKALEIIAYGEMLSTGLFHMHLTELGKKSAYIPALKFMRTDKEKEPDYFYIEESIDRAITADPFAQVYITEGFISRNSKGEIDNLGRGGSDYTAAIIGHAVNANEVQIWTDIDGLHNNDPRYVENTTPLRSLSYDEAAELAYFGAKILHPATIQPCRVKGIPVLLKNTLQPHDEGTLITAFYNPQGIKAIAAKDGITAINIRSSRMLLAYGFLNKVFEVFNQYKTAVDMITTSEVAISLTIDNTESLDAIAKQISEFASVDVEQNQTIICIVGDFVANHNGYAALVFNALKEIPIRMISYGGSSDNISILIDNQNKVKALKALQLIVDSNITTIGTKVNVQISNN